MRVVLFTTGRDVSYEELGAVELLKMHGVDVEAFLPLNSSSVDLHLARVIFSGFGVNVRAYEPGDFGKEPCVVSFGRSAIFDLIREFSDRPRRVVYGISNEGVRPAETKANADGLIDEIFVKSRSRGVEVSKQFVVKSNQGVHFRNNYVPFCNPTSDYFKWEYQRKKAADTFYVLRDTPDRPEYCYPEQWLMVSKITCPWPRTKRFIALNWGKRLSKKAGSPADKKNVWSGLLDVTLEPSQIPIEQERKYYADASALLHFHPAEELFSFAAAKAILSGAVVVAPPTSAYLEMIRHDETGLLAKSIDEAGYQTSRLAWDPFLRMKLATNAYAWFTNEGPGNPDNCFEWWKGVL